MWSHTDSYSAENDSRLGDEVERTWYTVRQIRWTRKRNVDVVFGVTIYKAIALEDGVECNTERIELAGELDRSTVSMVIHVSRSACTASRCSTSLGVGG